MAYNERLSYRPDIQGIRAISIIFVVLNHAGLQFAQGGYVGVDVFFVLSGYLITGLLVKEHRDYGKIKPLDFYARRLKRLLPALFVMLAVVVLCGSWLLPDYQLTQQTASASFAATWSSNLFFSLTTVEYFSELKDKDLFLHTWSLGVEEQFYLIWPMLVALSFLLSGKLGDGSRWGMPFVTMLILCFLCSFGLSQYWKINNPVFAFYMMPSRIWQFTLGALSYIWLEKDKDDSESRWPIYFSSAYKTGFGLIGMGLMLGSAVFFHANMAYPGAWALLPSIGALLLIASGYSNKGGIVNRTLTHPLLVWIGDRSYSWYLWHWPVLMLGFSVGMAQGSDKVAGLVGLSFLLAMLSYRFVELPFWKGRFSNAKPPVIILSSLLSMLVLVLGCQNYLQSTRLRSEAQAASFVDMARGDLPVIYRMGCDAWYANADVKPCVFGDDRYVKTVVLMGDSIAAQWFSLLPAIFRSPEWRTIVLTKSSCPMVDEDFFYAKIGKIYTVCREWRDAAITYLSSIRPDVIFVGNTVSRDFTEKQWVEGSGRIFSRLRQVAKKVVVLPGTYALPFDGPSCLERNLPSVLGSRERNPEVCSGQASNAEQVEKVVNYLKRAIGGLPDVSLLNLNDLTCPHGRCGALNEKGDVVFRDLQHLTDTFVRAQAPTVRERLKYFGIEVSP